MRTKQTAGKLTAILMALMAIGVAWGMGAARRTHVPARTFSKGDVSHAVLVDAFAKRPTAFFHKTRNWVLPVWVAPDVERQDTIITPVAPTDPSDPYAPQTYSGDLRTPDNIETGIFLDERTGQYRFGTRLKGNTQFLSTPLLMTPDEVARRDNRRIRHQWFANQNRTEAIQQGKEKFDFTDMHFDLGLAEKIFGPGGVRIKTTGSASLKIGANTRFVDNPSLSERNRNVFGFDFNEDINLSLNARVGDKVNMDFNYNSKAAATFDSQNIRLRYEGKEDEIIKLIEAGNISMPTTSSLLRGASSLFGIRTDFQFGRLQLSAVVSQKKSSSSNVSSGRGGV